MSKDFALIKRGPFYVTLPGEDSSGTAVDNRYPELDVMRYGASASTGVDDKTAIQRAVDYAEARGGGNIMLRPYHEINSGLVINNHAVRLVFAGGAARGTTVAGGGRIIYKGGAGAAIKFDGGAGGIQGCGLEGVRVENQGSGSIGVHVFNASNSRFAAVHTREFSADNWLLECDTNVSTIYNDFLGISGFTTGTTAIGMRMVEGAGKAVNNNLIMNGHFGNNLVGIQQDSECHDNAFVVVELGSCTTGAKIRGRIGLYEANIENCTTGLDLITGSAYSVSGSLHFQSNTTDVANPDGRPLFCSMQGGGASNTVGFNPTNTGMGFRGRVVPVTGGWNLSTADGDPVIQRADVEHIKFLLGRTAMNVPLRGKGYTVATLPAGSQGDWAFVTDALGPVFLVAAAGGGAVVTPVFYNGTQWVVA